MKAMKEYQRDTVQFVKIGFNDACINWLAVFNRYEFEDLYKSIASVTEYNNFVGANVAKVAKHIAPYVNSFSFGREGSPVLYIELKREAVEQRGKDELVSEIREAFEPVLPDEFHVGTSFFGDAVTLRVWFD